MRRSSMDVVAIRRRIKGLVEDRGSDLIRSYYDPDQGFAGPMFDNFGDNSAGRLTPDDLIAASLLDVRFGPAAVRELLINGSANALLQLIPNDENVALWNTELARDSASWRLGGHSIVLRYW